MWIFYCCIHQDMYYYYAHAFSIYWLLVTSMHASTALPVELTMDLLSHIVGYGSVKPGIAHSVCQASQSAVHCLKHLLSISMACSTSILLPIAHQVLPRWLDVT